MHTKGKRHIYLDSAAGILLIYMIVYHCAQWSGMEDTFLHHTLWLSFFMPWFFFKSGMFYRRISLRENAKKGFHRLIVPWIAFSVIGSVVYFIIMYAQQGEVPFAFVITYIKSVLLTGTTLGNMALWFLFSLYAVRIIYGVLEPLRHSMLYIVLIVSIPFVFHYGIEPNVSESVMKKIPYYICNIPSGLLFYALGHKLNKIQIRTPYLLALLAVYTGVMVFAPSYVFMYQNELYIGCYALAPLYSLLGIISINALCKRWADTTSVISRIGADTMPFYCMHWIIIEITLAIVDKFLTIDDSAKFATLICANVVMLPVLTYLIRKTRLKFIFG